MISDKPAQPIETPVDVHIKPSIKPRTLLEVLTGPELLPVPSLSGKPRLTHSLRYTNQAQLQTKHSLDSTHGAQSLFALALTSLSGI